MRLNEEAIVLEIHEDRMLGILHRSEDRARLGVVVIVGGPQYRVGSHRQFVLLARALAGAGFPVLRFDHRGIGDSTGAPRTFANIDLDVRIAIDAMIARTGVERIVLWGLCDAVSAAMLYAHSDPRVVGLVLLNPWVHAVGTEAQVRIRTYYTGQLRSATFWRKVLSLNLDWRDSLGSLWGYVKSAVRARLARRTPQADDFIERMRRGWSAFHGSALVILSGDDLTAAEFRQLTSESSDWRALLARKSVRTLTFPDANHTFARAEWRAGVERETVAWLSLLDARETETR